MFELLSFSAEAIAWGFLIGLFFITMFFVMIKGWWKNASFGLSSYIIGFILGVVLIYQSILTCGAIVLIKGANYCEPIMTELVNQYTDNAEKIMSPETSEQIFKNLVQYHPYVAHYLDGYDLEECSAREFPHVVVSEIKSNMRWFIFRRVLWSMGLTILSAVLVIKLMPTPRKSSERSRRYVSRTDRTRVSRRRR